jgi:hypothetical protein
MVGVINPNKDVSLATQKQFAANSSYMLQPGEPFPEEASASMSMPTPDPTSFSTAPVAPSNTAAATTSAAAAPAAHHGLSSGAIAGIAVGSAAVALLAAALFFFIGRTHSYKHLINRQSATVSNGNPSFYSADMSHNGGGALIGAGESQRSPGLYDGPPRYASPEPERRELASPTPGPVNEVFSQHSYGEHRAGTPDR